MKKLIITLCAALFSFAFAQNSTLESVTSNLSKHQITTGKFAQAKTLSANGRTLKSSGNFVFCLEGIMWQTLKPFASGLAVTKTQIIQTSANGKQTVTDTSNNETFKSVSGTIISIFSNDIENIKTNFDIRFTDNNNGTWEMALTPKDKTVAAILESFTLRGTASEAEAVITELSMKETSGDVILYSFSEHNYPQELTSDEKSFFKAR